MRTAVDRLPDDPPVASLPPRIPMLDADDLPGDDDWTLLTALRVDDDIDLERHADPYGALRLSLAALD